MFALIIKLVAKRVKQRLPVNNFKQEIMVLEQAAVLERSMVRKTL